MPYEGRGFSTRDYLTQLGELDSLSTCLPSSCGTSGDKLRKNLKGATHWAAEFDVVSVLGGEGEEGRGDGLGTYGQ